MATRTALFFEIFAADRTSRAFTAIMRSTDTLSGKIGALGKLAAGAAATGIGLFAAQGVRSFLEFDDKMTSSLAIMGEVSGPMRAKMESAARAVGKSTRFGASEAAEAYFFLASAGLDAQQSVGAMPQVARFAQAGMFGLARATDLATDAQSALGLSVADPERNLQNLTRVTDVLVGANTLANASVEQFAESLTGKAGPAMRQAGIEIETGVAVLAVYADQGLKAERASTVLAGTLEQLQRNAINNAGEFERLGIQVFDAHGNMRSLTDITGDLDRSLGGMSLQQRKAELMQLGFNRTALEGIDRLIGLSGQVRAYESDLQSMGDITEEVADKQLESFAARLDLLQSRVADFALTVGQSLVNAGFEVGETVGEMHRMFSQLPAPLRVANMAALGIVAAAPLAIGAWRKLRAIIESVRASYMAMGVAGRTATLSLGAVGIALAAGAAILAFFARRNLEAQNRVDSLRDSLDRQSGAVTRNTREIAAKQLAESGALEMAERLGISLKTVTDAALGEADAIREVREATEDWRDAQHDGMRETHAAREAAANLNQVLGESREELERATQDQRRHAEAVGEGDNAQGDLEGQIEETNSAIEDQVSELDELIKSLDDMVKSVFAARDASRGYEQALDDAREAAGENGATLDITTEKGRKNQEQLDKLASAALKDAAATLEDAEAKGDLAGAQEAVTEKMSEARDAFIKVAREMGLSRSAAKKLADELGLIPGNYEAIVTADTADARAAVEGFISWANRQRAVVGVRGEGLTANQGGAVQAFAGGGFARAGQLAQVGERGPELVRFGQNARVFSHSDTAGLLRQALRGTDGATSRPLTIEIPVQIGDEVVRVVRYQIDEHDRSLVDRVTAGAGAAR